MKIRLFTALILGGALLSCGPTNTPLQEAVKEVDPTHFIQESLLSDIRIEEQKLRDGTSVDCYVITVKSVAHEHPMGPWCPRHIEEGKEQGGIWFDDGEVYDVDGHFIASLADFYADEKWQLYHADGSIKVTESQEACEGAAKPRVEEIYKNHCVECQPSFYDHLVFEYHIPVTPIYQSRSSSFGRDPLGLALNGVNFDPPAPTEAILRAHTLAPLDDCGGHVNPHAGYHYHATTGCTKEVEQPDNHAPLIGYALDGFGIYARLDKDGLAPASLDQCRGHEDATRGYHYHAGPAGGNEVISCLNGSVGRVLIK